MNAAALGEMTGGFLVTILVPYIMMRVASRKPNPDMLQTWAVIVAIAMAYFGYTGSGGHINIGSVAACVVIVAWMALSKRRPQTPPSAP